jgi:hypothetical protein
MVSAAFSNLAPSTGHSCLFPIPSCCPSSRTDPFSPFPTRLTMWICSMRIGEAAKRSFLGCNCHVCATIPISGVVVRHWDSADAFSVQGSPLSLRSVTRSEEEISRKQSAACFWSYQQQDPQASRCAERGGCLSVPVFTIRYHTMFGLCYPKATPYPSAAYRAGLTRRRLLYCPP